LIRQGNPPRMGQNRSWGTSHQSRDVQSLDEIDLEATYKAKDLINLIRARTFAPYRGAYFQCGGRKIYVSLQLAFGDEAMP
jgi:methionyl-tRNA formyltransferase